MKKTKYLFILLSLILVLSFAACGSASTPEAGYSLGDSAGGVAATSVPDRDAAISNTNSKSNAVLENVVNSETNRKIIYSYSLTMRTKEYDSNISSIRSSISQYGGYIENSSEKGSKPQNVADAGRYLSMTVRIPVAKAQEFFDKTSALAEVLGSQTSGSDVTQSYMDIETRIKNIQIRLESLQALLKKATSMTDIITLQKELNDATVELEGYTSTKQQYDNLTEYATISISLEEVNTSSTISADGSNLSFWESVSAGFNSVISGLWFFIKNALIFLLSASPVLVLAAAIALAIIIPTKKRRKQKLEKLNEFINKDKK